MSAPLLALRIGASAGLCGACIESALRRARGRGLFYATIQRDFLTPTFCTNCFGEAIDAALNLRGIIDSDDSHVDRDLALGAIEALEYLPDEGKATRHR